MHSSLYVYTYNCMSVHVYFWKRLEKENHTSVNSGSLQELEFLLSSVYSFFIFFIIFSSVLFSTFQCYFLESFNSLIIFVSHFSTNIFTIDIYYLIIRQKWKLYLFISNLRAGRRGGKTSSLRVYVQWGF